MRAAEMHAHPSVSLRWRRAPRPIADVLSDFLDELAEMDYERGFADGYKAGARQAVRATYTAPGTRSSLEEKAA